MADSVGMTKYMDQVTVPQFIDAEDKILGPITVRQFVILFVAAIILFLFYKFADFTVFIFACIIVGGIAGVAGFLKINGQPFHYFLLHIFETLQRPSLRVWRKQVSRNTLQLHWGRAAKAELEEEKEKLPVPVHERLSDRKLSDIALILDTGGAYHGEHDEGTELFHEGDAHAI